MMSFKCSSCGLQKEKESAEDISICADCGGDYQTCCNCKKEFICNTDLWLCDNCMPLFDLEGLWEMHDKNELDGLDFNENETLRERFRI